MSKTLLPALGLAIVFVQPASAADAPKAPAAKSAPVTSADVAKAETARKKPLQRCDELADKAQVECLQKAREGIVQARQKREAAGKGAGKESAPK